MAKLEVGDRAPEIGPLEWTGEGEFQLSAQRGNWVIVAFYPGDFTAVCTRQFCNYRDGREQIDGLDAIVVGISPQDLRSHQRFTDEHGLTVPLAADTEMQAAKAFGVLGPGGRMIRRSIFIVDPEGIVRYRKVALVGLGYEDVGDLAGALEQARASAA